MQPDEILKQFEIYVDDATELSASEEYILLTKVLNTIYNDRPWEFLRKSASIVTTTANTAPLPADFVSAMNNYSEDNYNNIPEKTVAFIGGIPFYFIPRGLAVQKAGGNYCYIDIANNNIVFTASVGTAQTVTFDYKYQPIAITSNASVIAIPSQFRHYLGQVMAIDDDIIQKTEKARSNYATNQVARLQLMRDLAHYDLRMQNY